MHLSVFGVSFDLWESMKSVVSFQMKFNSSTNNHNNNNNSSSSNNGNKNTTTNTSSGNSSSSDYLGMNEIDTDTHVVWPSWCYAGNIHIADYFSIVFAFIHFIPVVAVVVVDRRIFLLPLRNNHIA